MNVSIEQAKHNNSVSTDRRQSVQVKKLISLSLSLAQFRQMLGTDEAHKDVNDIVLMGANKRYVKPTLDEGFTELVLVNQQTTFDDAELEKLYFQYILDK